MHQLKLTISCVFTFIACAVSSAQAPYFEHFTTYEGLSHNSILCITQDYRGFMWFGTGYGVNRYDGINFKKYLSDSSDRHTISGDYINCILADSKKTLWIGSANGLSKLDLETNTIERIPVSGSENGISSPIVRTLFEDREGNIWAGTTNGLNLLTNRATNSFAKFYADNEQGIAGNNVRCIFEDDENDIWIGTTNGLTRITKKSDTYQFRSYRQNPGKEALFANDFSSVIQDAAHIMWVGTASQGLYRFDKHTGAFTQVPMNGVPSKAVRTIVDHNGKFWIGTLEGLFVIDPSSGSDTLYSQSSSRNGTLSQNSVYSIFRDAVGSLWVGTYFGGINVAHPYKDLFSKWRHDETRNSISNDVVSGVTEDEENNLYVSTEGGGLNYINRKTGSVTVYKRDENKPESIGSNKVKTVYRDLDGDIWAGTTQGGLNLLNKNSGTFTHFIFDPFNPATSVAEVVTLLEDSQQRFWVGTSQGLKLYNKRGNTLLPDASEIISGDIATQYVSTIIEDAHQTVWVGGRLGLLSLKKNDKSFTRQNWTSSFVNSVFEDKKGNLWIAPSHRGLLVFDVEKKKLVTVPLSNETPGNEVLGITEDDNGNIWAATDIGLCRLNLLDSTFRIFNRSDGVVVGSNVRNAVFKSKTGELFFGGQNGLISFFPDKMQINRAASPLLFTSVRLINKQADAKVDSSLLTKDISLTDKIKFSSGQASFTIGFALLSYIKSEKNKYSYKLEGLDENWTETKTPYITYTRLAPGSYTLWVKAANYEGVWSNPISLKIEVSPPLWKSWWAWLGYIAIATGVLFFTHRYFLRRELKKIKAPPVN